MTTVSHAARSRNQFHSALALQYPRNGGCEERIALIPFVRSEFQLLRSFTLRVRLLRSRQTTKDDGLPHGSLRQLPNLGL